MNPTNPPLRASIAIVTYNGEDFVGPCLDSLGSGDIPPNEFEVIIIDNASVDETLAVVHAARTKFPHLRVERNDSNLGFAMAANQAADLAGAPILIFLNQDTTVDPSWLRELLLSIEPNSDIAASGSRVVQGDGPGLYAAALEVLYGGVCVIHEGNRRIDAVSGCAMAVRRPAFREVGGFAGDLFMYGEDLDLGYRLRSKGYRIAYAPRSVAHHFAIRRSRAASRTYMFYTARNRVLVCLRNYPRKRLYLLADVFVLFPLTSLTEVLRSVRRSQTLRWLLEARIESLRTAKVWLRSGVGKISGSPPAGL